MGKLVFDFVKPLIWMWKVGVYFYFFFIYWHAKIADVIVICKKCFTIIAIDIITATILIFSRVSHAISSFIQREPSKWTSVPPCQQAAPHQWSGEGDPKAQCRGCGQSHSAEHKECCSREKMDPAWPPQPLQMEPGSLKSWFPTLSSSKVRPKSQFLSELW